MDISKFENNTYLRIETNAAFRSIDIFLFYYKDQKTYFYNATKEYEIVIEEIQSGMLGKPFIRLPYKSEISFDGRIKEQESTLLNQKNSDKNMHIQDLKSVINILLTKVGNNV